MRSHLLSLTLVCCICSPVAAQDFVAAYPFTAKIATAVPANPVPSTSVFMPSGGNVSCLDAVANASRYVCLSDSGTVLEWTPDNQFRRLANGFKGPINAKATPDGTVWVLDYGLGLLFRIARNGSITEILGRGPNTDILRPNAGQLNLRSFIIPASGPSAGVELASDPDGNIYLAILDEAFFGTGAARQIRRKFAVLRIRAGSTSPELFWDASPNFALLPDAQRITALAVDASQNVLFVLNNKLHRRTATGTLTELAGGRFSPLDADPVKYIVPGPAGDYILHTTGGVLFRLGFSELRTDFDSLGRLEGVVARQGPELVAIDLELKRLLGYSRNSTGGYSPRELAKLLQFIPIVGTRTTRQPLERPVSVTVDRDGLLLVVEDREGSLFRFANDNTVIRLARSTYDASNPPPAVLRTENYTLDTLPFRIVAAASSSEGRLHLLDRACNLFVQTDSSNVRRVHQLLTNTECAAATILFDADRRVIVSLHPQGQIHLGTGSADSGEWNFRRIYSAASPILSTSSLPSGEIFTLEGDGKGTWLARRVNPVTLQVATIDTDAALSRAGLKLISAAVDSRGNLFAVNCCVQGTSPEIPRNLVLTLFYSGSRITGSPVALPHLETLPGEQPQAVFSTSRGFVVRSTGNRLFTTDISRVRPPESPGITTGPFSLGATFSLVFTPGMPGRLQIPIAANTSFLAYRTGLFCDSPYSGFAQLGPAAGFAPATLVFSLLTQPVALPRGTCTVTVRSDNDGFLSRAQIFLIPNDPTAPGSAQPAMNDISVFDTPPPFVVDITQPEVVRSVYVLNRAPSPRVVNVIAPAVDGLLVEPAVLSIPAFSIGTFPVRISPKKLTFESYSLTFRATCPQCVIEEKFTLSFQISRNPAAIELSSESTVIDEAVVIARNQSVWTLANVLLTGLSPSDILVQTDFPGNAKPWFAVSAGSSNSAASRSMLRYDLTLDRNQLPKSATSATVSFQPATPGKAARRFVTVFFIPESEGTRSQIIGFEGGAAVSLAKGEIGAFKIPIHSRSDVPLTYSAFAARGATSTAVVYSRQGTVFRGPNTIDLNVERTDLLASSSEPLDVTITFSNGERLLYKLNVLSGELTPETPVATKGGLREAGKCASRNLVITPREPALPFSVRRNIGLRFVFELRDNCNQFLNAADGASLIFNVSPANGSISTTSLGNGLWDVFWRPERVAEEAVVRIVAVRAPNEFEVYAGQLTLTGAVTDTSVPSVRAFSVVDGASFVEKQITAPGAVISIFGENLASTPLAAASVSSPLPRELDGLNVQFNGRSAPLWFVSPSQLNIQVPAGLPPDEYRVFVTRGAFASAPAAVNVGSSSPGIFTVNQTGSGQGLILHTIADGQVAIAGPDNPVPTGAVVTILANGLGATSPALEEGAPAPLPDDSTPVHSVRGAVEVLIAGRPAELRSAHLAPGMIGIYQILAIVPPATEPGLAVPLRIRVDGVESQVVTLAVK